MFRKNPLTEEQDEEKTVKSIEFLRVYMLASTTSMKKMVSNIEKQNKEENLISFLNLKERLFEIVEISDFLIQLGTVK